MGRRKGVAGEKGLRWKEAWEARRRVGKKNDSPIRHLFQGWFEVTSGDRSPTDQLPNLTEDRVGKGKT